MPSDDHSKIRKSRQRASIACHGCRERRTRCVMLAGSAACMHCCETGQECILKQDDRRRRPVSKAYVNVLQRRIHELETALGAGSPQAHQQTTQEIPSGNRDSMTCSTVESSNQSQETIPGHCNDSAPRQKRPILEKNPPPKERFGDGLRERRLRGPTSGHHMKWHQWIQTSPDEGVAQAMQRRQRRAQQVIATICPETQNYLMNLFWQHYNSVIRVIHRDAFEEGLRSDEGAYYSYFLHICILAVGYRFADKKLPTIARITLSSRENSFHRKAKDMVGHEIEHPGGIPSIAGLLLLADLEGGCGRDNVGWLCVGVAIRLCFDIGLDRKPTQLQLSPQEVEIRRTTLRACVLYDRYWSLFLGRPLALRLDNLEAYQVTKTVDLLNARQLSGEGHGWETQIYEALLQLMELAGQIPDILEKMDSDKHQLPHQQYFHLAGLDHELSTWYSQLPNNLQYTTDNVQTAPISFFHLHQQYYSVMIMLHSELGRGNSDGSSPTLGSTGYHLALLSQVTSTTCAGRMAQIFSQQRQRFDINQMFSTGLQHAGSAASVLVTALASCKGDKSWGTNKKYLECIFAALEEMSAAYEAAERMVPALNSIMKELNARERHPSRTTKRGQESPEDPNNNLGRTAISSQIFSEVGGGYTLTDHSNFLTPNVSESLSYDTRSPSSLPSLWGGPDVAAFSQVSDVNLTNFDLDLPTPPMTTGEEVGNAGFSSLFSDTHTAKTREEHPLPGCYEPWTADPIAMAQMEEQGANGMSRGLRDNPKTHMSPIDQDMELLGMAQGVWSDLLH